ncbi:hypothetical protein EXN66_Car001852 [Channa argus]|uniref:Uncharacterized protein n=1 Tax=Channa argus TaxID=215402 RepID=A0A6G1P7A4_CHAAH|nr:hypothetical protein EXN66_Car001852 [Channa argus]
MSRLPHLVTHQRCDSLTFGSFIVSLIYSFLSLTTAGQPRSVIVPVLSACGQDKHAQRRGEKHTANNHSSQSFTQEY